MNFIGSLLDKLFNEGKEERDVGFALLVFDFTGVQADRINYISNSERQNMIGAMREFIARADGDEKLGDEIAEKNNKE
jgi:hypothetical protein